MTIRLATGDDVAALADLEREVFGGDAWDARALVAELEGPGRRVVVSDAPSGEPAGYAVSMTLGDIVDLQRIVVRPEHRRGGLATALLEDLLAHTGAADRMLLEVSEGNGAAVAFYVAHGFTAHRRATALLPRRVGRPGPAAGPADRCRGQWRHE